MKNKTLPTQPPVLAHTVLDLRRIFRFTAYNHAVPLAALEEMEFDPSQQDDDDSLGMLWLRPRENYPVYLREGGAYSRYKRRQALNRYDVETVSDGGPVDHLVAVEILKPDVQAHYGSHYRRTRWVKQYDAFHGYVAGRHGPNDWYGSNNPDTNAHHPSEAVEVSPGSMDVDRTSLRPWSGQAAVTRVLDWSRVPAWNHPVPPRTYPYWKRIGEGNDCFHLIVLHGTRPLADYAIDGHGGDWMALRWRNPHARLGDDYATRSEAQAVCEADYQKHCNRNENRSSPHWS